MDPLPKITSTDGQFHEIAIQWERKVNPPVSRLIATKLLGEVISGGVPPLCTGTGNFVHNVGGQAGHR